MQFRGHQWAGTFCCWLHLAMHPGAGGGLSSHALRAAAFGRRRHFFVDLGLRTAVADTHPVVGFTPFMI